MNRITIILSVLALIGAYVAYSQYKISSLSGQLSQKIEENESLQRKIKVEESVNTFVHQLKIQQRKEELELEEIPDENIKQELDAIILRFNGV